MRVDCHLHPNFHHALPRPLIRRKARVLWRAFARHKLDAVFISEHAFKKPALAFRYMQENKPKNATTMLVPAVEALTKEGMDIIVFSEDTYVYTRRDILTPFGLTADELLWQVNADPRLHAFIPHPFIPSNTGIIHHYGVEEGCETISKVKNVEKYNAALMATHRLFRLFRLHKVMKKMDRRFAYTAEVPDEFLPKRTVIFGGSDAHHTWHIGSYLTIHAERPASNSELFSFLISSKHRRTMTLKKCRLSTAAVITLLDSVTVFLESMRKRLHLYHVDTTYLPDTETESEEVEMEGVEEVLLMH